MLSITACSRIAIKLTGLCTLFNACGSAKMNDDVNSEYLKSPMIIAHRGYAQFAPENTLAAFSEAVRVSSDMVELDYHHTFDDEQIVIHDRLYDRTTNVRTLTGKANVEVSGNSSKLASQLSAGSWFDPSFASEKLPFLGESLAYINLLHGIALIDHKSGSAASCVRTIEGLGLIEQVVVQSANWKFLKELRALSPRIAISALGREEIDATTLAKLEKLRPNYVAWEYSFLDETSIASLHQLDTKVLAFVVNSPRKIRRLLRANVDGFITDQVELAQATVKMYRDRYAIR